MATIIDDLQIKIASSSTSAVAEIDKLTSSLERLKKASSLTKVKNGLNKVNEALTQIGNNKQTLTQLEKTATALDNASTSTKGFAKNLKELNKVSKSSNTTLGGLGKKLVSFISLHMVTRALSYSVDQLNEYVENLNLFSVSMGKFYNDAKEYAELVQDKMGIDSSEWMRAQGTFMTMATGFNLAKEQAYEMSKGLTELSYDLSSLYNRPIEEAFTKLRSAMAGEIEPLRQWGISLTQATLQQVALANGITKNINAMTEAEKAQLRYVAIIQAADRQGVIGDFANTLSSPANALKILKQQIVQMARAIGMVLLPIIVQVLPYVQAFVKVLTEAITRLALFLGFEMPTFDARPTTSGLQQVGEALDKTGKKVEEYKRHFQGFDEINIIPAPKEKGSGNGLNIGTGGDLGLDISSIWEKADIEKLNTKANELASKMKHLGTATLAFVGGLVGLKVLKSVVKDFTAFKQIIKTAVPFLKPIITFFGSLSGGTIALGLIGLVSLFIALKERLGEIKSLFEGVFEKLGLKDKIDGIKKSLKPLTINLDGLYSLLKTIGDMLLVGLQPLFALAVGLINGLVSAIQPLITLVDGVILVFSSFGSFLTGDFSTALTQFSEGGKKIFDGFFGFINEALVGFTTGALTYIADFKANVMKVVQLMISNVKTSINVWLADMLVKFGEWWLSVKSWYNTNVAPKLTKDYWLNKWNGFKDGFVQTVKNMLNAGIDLVNKFIRNINSKLKFSWDGLTIAGKQIYGGGSVQIVKIPEIQKFDTGGFIEDGLFTMNKGEIAGKFSNGQSVVANNYQIVDGISKGVYDAVVSAMGGNSGTSTINVIVPLDGKVIGEQVIKYHNGVVMRTGKSPLVV